MRDYEALSGEDWTPHKKQITGEEAAIVMQKSEEPTDQPQLPSKIAYSSEAIKDILLDCNSRGAGLNTMANEILEYIEQCNSRPF